MKESTVKSYEELPLFLNAETVAKVLGIDPSRINVKAKTNEKMGFTGREEGIETRAVALIN